MKVEEAKVVCEGLKKPFNMVHSVNIVESQLIEADSWEPLFEALLGGMSVSWMPLDQFNKLNWEIEADGLRTGLFKAEKVVPEHLEPASAFWNEEKEELVLPPFAEKTLETGVATMTRGFEESLMVKVNEHKEVFRMLVSVATCGSFSTTLRLWMEEVA